MTDAVSLIRITYSAIDGARMVRRFKTIEGARAFAVKYVGADAEFGSSYAVSSDGIGKIEVEGVSLRELFGRPKPTYWYALDSRDARHGTHQVGGPYATEAQAQGAFWSWPEDERVAANLAIGKWSDENDFVGYVTPKRDFPPQPAFAVVRIYPVYSPIHDGLIGHDATIVSQHASATEAEAECSRQIEAGGEPVEYGDYGFEVRRWVAPTGPYRDGYYGPRVAPQSLSYIDALGDDEIPF